MVIGKRLLPLLAIWLLCTVPIAARPTATLSVVPTNIVVAGDDATLVTSQTVRVSNAGKGSLKWTVTPPAESWLSVSPTSGTNTGTITVSFPSLFAEGTYTSSFTVNYSRQTVIVHVTVTITQAAAPPPSNYGPTSDITCPGGAVNVLTTDDLQTAVNANGAGTTFCLEAGTHSVTSAVTPKTGDVFVGAYGAILDGTSWSTTDTNQGAFRAHNQDIDNVTVRNLVIQNMPQKGIHVLYGLPSGWIVEYCEIANNKTGIEMGATNGVVRNNYIHDNITATPDDATAANRGGGYGGYRSVGVLWEHNEIGPGNGSEQKIVGSQNVTFRNNYVHDNYKDGIWYDGDNTGAVIEDNTLEDNGRNAIFYEISWAGTIQNNTIRRSVDSAVFVSSSHDVVVTGNTIEANYRGVNLFLDCSRVTSTHDLANVSVTSNTIVVPNVQYVYGSGFSWTNCTTAQYSPYLSGSKNLVFESNAYTVPTLTDKYWVWGFNSYKYWTDWVSVPQDAAGSVSTP